MAEFDESKHPRDEEGKFTYKGGGRQGTEGDKRREAVKKYSDDPGRDMAEMGLTLAHNRGAESKKAIQFDNGMAANQYFRDVEEKWLKSLDADAKKILNEYTNELYYNLNAYLRGFPSNYNLNRGEIEKIDSAIDNFVLKDPITVYRAVTSSKELAGTTLKKGDQIYWKAYTSTSMDKEAVNGEQYMLYEIEVPQGKGKGAYINSLSEYKDIEYEFLLKRDTTAEVTDVIEENGKKIIKLKVVEK